ncbi:hypothetical protein BJP40_08495 [Streptomyces sp. CC53]|uniref:hypothetical protein n=1 Tax=Streptomyces sp. CC53 TaxID=1906740 RepID=UPI0008DD663A|nr:hypothetical protein [Streptomyces sp. CC53]OII60971.1 hypothetical protein BJP40_08495 [Streptomyces sp. CC53]
MPAFAFTLLIAGLTAGITGLLGNNDDLWRVGLFAVLTAAPLLVIRTVHASLRVSAAALADADLAGYARALDHVARGLLDVPAPPCPGNRADRHVEQVAGNVIPLRPSTENRIERKAL